MPLLNNQKTLLLSQVQKQPNIDITQLVKLLHTYDDLHIEDFRGIISDFMYEQLQEAGRDPREVELWNRITSAPRHTPEDIQNVQQLLSSYMQQFPTGNKADEANIMMNNMHQEMADAIERKRHEEEAAREKNDWLNLERGKYNALQAYRSRYPDSVHMSELDDLMWACTQQIINHNSLSRYLNDWPLGNHAAEANQALSEIQGWENVKRNGDLFEVADYMNMHPTTPFINEVRPVYYTLRDDALSKMKETPSKYSKDDVTRMINSGIFSLWDLKNEELITDESWETLQLDRDEFPQLSDYQVSDPNLQAPADCTDIYLFGTPGTGKTCLLMGLTGANGHGYTLNMKAAGGPYASALQQYVQAGITPGSTFGSFVTTINGQISETGKRGRILSHRINLVEMSGEEFALRIAEGQGVSLADMGTGATNLLQNDNRKVFFIIVDASDDRIKVETEDFVRDIEGNVIDVRLRKRYISQLDILNKFMSLFELPENQEIMSKVDAIHFIVTKADILGNTYERKEKARDLLLSRYRGPVEQLKTYCRRTKRVNYSTSYSPQVFTFSLGKFYVGDVFSFDHTETLQIIDAIRAVTGSVKEPTWLDRLKAAIG